jgi:hypothetical protein
MKEKEGRRRKQRIATTGKEQKYFFTQERESFSDNHTSYMNERTIIPCLKVINVLSMGFTCGYAKYKITREYRSGGVLCRVIRKYVVLMKRNYMIF